VQVDDITFVGILEVLLLWMVLYNYIIPLSLYVSLEFQKFISSLQFVWDGGLYDPDTDEPAQGRSAQPCPWAFKVIVSRDTVRSSVSCFFFLLIFHTWHGIHREIRSKYSEKVVFTILVPMRS
jgi:hypothetical protein